MFHLLKPITLGLTIVTLALFSSFSYSQTKTTNGLLNGEFVVSHPFLLEEEITYRKEEINQRILIDNDVYSLRLFAAAKGTEMASHAAPGDALLHVLEGRIIINIDGKNVVLHKGESLVFPAGAPHTLEAPENYKMLLFITKELKP